MRRRGAALVVAGLGLLPTAPPASAAVVSMSPFGDCDSGGCEMQVHVTAGPGEENDIEIRLAGGGYLVRDSGSSLRAGGGCRKGRGGVLCEDGQLYKVGVDLGDRDDSLVLYGDEAAVSAGDGNDRVVVHQGRAILDGGPGGDQLGGADAGTVTVSYEHAAAPVSATVDGHANDGTPAEGDNLVGRIYAIVGGSGADELHGTADTGELVGGAGNDVLVAGASPTDLAGEAGDDRLVGGPGTDQLVGGPGADLMTGGGRHDTVSYMATLNPTGVNVSLDGRANDGAPGEGDDAGSGIEGVVGSPSADVIVGDDGANALDGYLGRDVVRGGPGADAISGGRGRDRLDAGADEDVVTASSGDRVVTADGAPDRVNCGHTAPALAGDPDDRFSSCAPAPGFAGPFRVRHRRIRVRLVCPRLSVIACTGRVNVRQRGRGRIFGLRRFAPLAPGGRRTVPVKLRRLPRIVRGVGFVRVETVTRRAVPPSTTIEGFPERLRFRG